MPNSKVFAGVFRQPLNGIESDRLGARGCGIPAQPPQPRTTAYGAVWVNTNVNATGSTRWAETVNVASNATTVNAAMWSTAIDCAYGRPISGAKIINIKPAPVGNDLPFTILGASTTIYRGDALPGQWTDPPGGLKININVGNKRSGYYTLAYYGTYQDANGLGQQATYYTSVNLQRIPPNWTLSGSSRVSVQQQLAGSKADFTHTISNSGPDTASGWKYTTSYIDTDNNGAVIGSGTIPSLSNTTGSASLTSGASVPKVDSFTIPSTWKKDYMRCEHITYDAYKSPPPASGSSSQSSADACVKVIDQNTPQGTITAASCTTLTSGSIAVKFFDPDGPTSAFISVDGNSYVTANSSPYTWSGVTIPPSGSASITLFVKDVGPGAPGTYTIVDTGTLKNTACQPPGGGPPPVTPSNCPGDPKIASNSLVPIDLPDKTPPNPNTPGTSSTTANNSYEQDVMKGKTNVTAVSDISSGGLRIGLANPPASQSYQKAIVDYAPFVDSYRYDHNQAQVTYDSYYTKTTWYTKSDPVNDGFYSCSSGTLDGTHCDYTGTADGWTCPSPYGDGSSATCSWTHNVSYTYPGTCTAYNADGTCSAYDCGSSTCTGTKSQTDTTPGTANHWTCNGGYGGGTTSACYFMATPNYYWHSNTPTDETVSSTADGYTMNACFNRNFTVQQPTDAPTTDVLSVALQPESESPTSATVQTQTAVRFSLIHGGYSTLRQGMTVKNLNYAASYYIEHADGSAPTQLYSNDPATQDIPGIYMSDGNTGQISYTTPPIALSFPPLMVGDKVCAQFTVTPSTGEIDLTNAIVSGTASGTTSSSVIPAKNTCSPPVTNKPYARFYGNDVIAGATFANSGAACNNNAAISTYNGGGGAQPTGSGGQFAAMSLGSISEFASAFLRSAGQAPTAPSGLSFANTAGGFGGSFGGVCTQLPDFYNKQQPPNPTAASLSALPAFPNGTSSYSTSTGRISGLTIPAGRSVSIFVNGDVHIDGNITYDTAGWYFDPSNRTTTVPSLYLIASGNIYISPNVTQLDGVYIAQPGSGGGSIRTCSQSDGSPFDASGNFFSSCNQQLTVYGSLIAQDIYFDRSFSSMRHSIGGESINPINGSQQIHNCDANGAVVKTDCSAELINFSPETYINMPALQPATSAKKNNYDFITTLSPVL